MHNPTAGGDAFHQLQRRLRIWDYDIRVLLA